MFPDINWFRLRKLESRLVLNVADKLLPKPVFLYVFPGCMYWDVTSFPELSYNIILFPRTTAPPPLAIKPPIILCAKRSLEPAYMLFNCLVALSPVALIPLISRYPTGLVTVAGCVVVAACAVGSAVAVAGVAVAGCAVAAVAGGAVAVCCAAAFFFASSSRRFFFCSSVSFSGRGPGAFWYFFIWLLYITCDIYYFY